MRIVNARRTLSDICCALTERMNCTGDMSVHMSPLTRPTVRGPKIRLVVWWVRWVWWKAHWWWWWWWWWARWRGWRSGGLNPEVAGWRCGLTHPANAGGNAKRFARYTKKMTAVTIWRLMDDESMRRLYVAPITAMAYDVVAKPKRSMMLSTIGAHRQPKGTRAEVCDGEVRVRSEG